MAEYGEARCAKRVNLLVKLAVVLRVSCLCLGQRRRYLFLSVGNTTSSSDDVVEPGIVADRERRIAGAIGAVYDPMQGCVVDSTPVDKFAKTLNSTIMRESLVQPFTLSDDNPRRPFEGIAYYTGEAPSGCALWTDQPGPVWVELCVAVTLL